MNREFGAVSEQAVREISRVWERFVSGQEVRLDKIRPEIRASWLRSRQAGVDPALAHIPMALEGDTFRQRCRQHTDLVAAGRETIASLSQTLSVETFIIGITDHEGNLLYSHVPSQERDQRGEVNAFPGAGVREHLIGTTAIATALLLDQPFQVYPFEHYTEFSRLWTEYAAPIHDAYGHIIGSLAFAERRTVVDSRMLDFVAFAAGAIEDKIRTGEKLAQADILAAFHRQLLQRAHSSILALDMQGRILALSPALVHDIALSFPDRLIGRPLDDVKDFALEGLVLPFAEDDGETSASFLVLPQREKVTSRVIPIPSPRGGQVGALVVVAEHNRPTPVVKKSRTSVWRSSYTFQDLIGCTPVFQQVLSVAKKAAAYDWPVFLTGESGTGKELFAQAIHSASQRKSGPFVDVNCSAIPKELAAAELLGYDEGAFSGALRGGKRGKVELAHGGTLLLDELADMPLEVQAHLLRCLEEGTVVPLASERPRPVDIRVIASMSSEPSLAVAQGKLRADLYHRLNVFPVRLPLLRERQEDLLLLARHLLDQEGFLLMQIAPEVIATFRAYPWPGNIRELRNVLLRAAALTTGYLLTCEHLPPELLHEGSSASPSPSGSPLSLDRAQIQNALRECGGNKSHAAKRLGVHWTTLHRKMRLYGLTRETIA